MIREIRYRGYGYRARHILKLIDALRLHDWTVTLRAIPPTVPMGWCCQLERNDRAYTSRCGSSMWDCLSRAVRDVVIPAEAGKPAEK